MNAARARRRACRWARHMNRTEVLGGHCVSRAAVRAMDHRAAHSTWYYIRRQSPIAPRLADDFPSKGAHQ